MTEFTVSIGRPKINKSSEKQLWELTQVGQTKIDNYSGPDNPGIKVLSSLSSIAPATIDDIAKDSNLGRDTILLHLRGFMSSNPPIVKLSGKQSKQ